MKKIFVPVMILALTLALLPPTSWDGLFYHLTGPKLYLQQGAIRPGPDIPHLNFPSLMEMNFLLAMAVGLFSLFDLPVERYPDVQMGKVQINTVLPGASPEDVESLITDEIEDALDDL